VGQRKDPSGECGNTTQEFPLLCSMVTGLYSGFERSRLASVGTLLKQGKHCAGRARHSQPPTKHAPKFSCGLSWMSRPPHHLTLPLQAAAGDADALLPFPS